MYSSHRFLALHWFDSLFPESPKQEYWIVSLHGPRKGNIWKIFRFTINSTWSDSSRMKSHKHGQNFQNRKVVFYLFWKSILESIKHKEPKTKTNQLRPYNKRTKWQTPKLSLICNQCSSFPRNDGESREIHPRHWKIQASNLTVLLRYRWARYNDEVLLQVSIFLLAKRLWWILSTVTGNHSFAVSTRRIKPKKRWHHRDLPRLMYFLWVRVSMRKKTKRTMKQRMILSSLSNCWKTEEQNQKRKRQKWITFELFCGNHLSYLSTRSTNNGPDTLLTHPVWISVDHDRVTFRYTILL